MDTRSVADAARAGRLQPGFTNGDACEVALSNLPGNNGVEPRAVNDNKAPLPPTNRSSWVKATETAITVLGMRGLKNRLGFRQFFSSL